MVDVVVVAAAAAVWVWVTVTEDVDPVTASVRGGVEADSRLVTVVVDGEGLVVVAEPAPSAAALARFGVVAEVVPDADCEPEAAV